MERFAEVVNGYNYLLSISFSRSTLWNKYESFIKCNLDLLISFILFKTNFKTIIPPHLPVKIYRYALLQTQYQVNELVNESIKFL